MERLRGRAACGGLLVGLVLTGCTAGTPSGSSAPGGVPDQPTTTSSSAAPAAPSPRGSPPGPGPTAGRSAPPAAGSAAPSTAAAFDTRAALRDIERLAEDIGPREATSRSFAQAAGLVQGRFEALRYAVRRESVDVPAGDSWGTRVRAGTSRNVIADPPGLDASHPHVVVVAHLDTVAVAPGAEDNASGIAVLLELARMAAAEPPGLPVRFIAFGAEEPRGTGDALHHFGSQQHVAGLSRAERSAIRAVVALDRVGVRASSVPVCSARASGNGLRSAVREAAADVGVPTHACSGNTTSDHWSYVKAGVPAIRLGSVPYPGYHSPDDTPDVIDRRQITRVGQAMWAWLQGLA